MEVCREFYCSDRIVWVFASRLMFNTNLNDRRRKQREQYTVWRTEPVCSCHTHAYGLSWSRFYFCHLSSSSFPTEWLCTCPGAVGISQPENDKVTKVKYMCGKHRNTVFPYFVQIRGPHQNDAIFTGKLLTMLFSLSLFVWIASTWTVVLQSDFQWVVYHHSPAYNCYFLL